MDIFEVSSSFIPQNLFFLTEKDGQREGMPSLASSVTVNTAIKSD